MELGKEYRVVNKNIISTCSLETLSRVLRPGCEVFEIGEGGKDTFLGILSHKALICIAVELIDIAFKECSAIGSNITKKCLALCRKWIDDSEPLLEEDLSDIRGNGRILFMNYLLQAAINCVLAISSPDTSGNRFYAIFLHLGYIPDSALQEQIEYEMHGQFIIDFLKSEKHLFMV